MELGRSFRENEGESLKMLNKLLNGLLVSFAASVAALVSFAAAALAVAVFWWCASGSVYIAGGWLLALALFFLTASVSYRSARKRGADARRRRDSGE